MIAAVDVDCIYELPLALHAEGIDEKITELLNIWARQPDLSPWQRIVERFKKPSRGVGEDRRGRQVRAPARLVQVAARGARSTAASTTTCGSSSSTSTREQIEARGAAELLLGSWTRSSCPAASAIAGPRGRSRPSATRASEDPVLRDLPRHAARRRRVRAPRLRHDGRELGGVRSQRRLPGDRSDARPEGRRREGRDDAPRRVPVRAGQGLRRRGGVRRRRASASGTATGTRCRTSTARRWRRRGSCSPGRRPTSASSR